MSSVTKIYPFGYKGLLHIKCTRCGKRNSFGTKMNIENYKCNCGKKIGLIDADEFKKVHS